MIRIRNEELILEDTLNNMCEFCDHIYLYDDCSNDSSPEIYNSFPRVSAIRNDKWNKNQTIIQGVQRSELFEYAKWKHPEANFIYLDADERIDFDFEAWDKKSAVIMTLYDARMTKKDCRDFSKDDKLKGFRKYFDPTPRQIPFIFNAQAKYQGVDCERHPQTDNTSQNVINAGYVEHYGKAISKQHWQDTCKYYADTIPIYAEKWEARKKESGVVSSNNLLTWEQCKK